MTDNVNSIDFSGAGVVGSTIGDSVTETIAQGGHVVKDEGSALTQRANLNFIGAGVTATDNAGTNATDVTISGSTANQTLDSINVPLTLIGWLKQA